MPSLITPNPGDTILASHIFQLTGLIAGVAGKGQRVQFSQYSDAVNYANTLGNVDATNGYAAKIQYGPSASPTTIATFAKAGTNILGASATTAALTARNSNTSTSRALLLRNAENDADTLGMVRNTTGEDILVIGYSTDAVAAGAVSLCRSFTYKSLDAGQVGYSMAKFEVDTTSNGDYGAIGAVIRQNTSGHASIRALEGHATRLSPATMALTWGAEIGVHVNVAGDGVLQNLGAFIYCDDNLIGGAPAMGVQGDVGVWIGGNKGFQNPLRITKRDLSTVLFNVEQGSSQTGTVTAGSIQSLSNEGFNLGSAGNRWLTAYSKFFIAEDGLAIAPSITFRSSATVDGFFLPSAHNIGVTLDSVERLRFGTLLDFRESTAAVANGTTGIITLGNYGGTGRPTAAAQNSWLKVQIGGVDSWIPVWR